MATTPNYGWVMPDPTDFVTDLPADFEIFGDAVDTTLEAIETKLDVITTEGDLVVGDASGDPVRIGVGTIGQVLASDGDTVEWVTPATGKSWQSTSGNLSGAQVNITGLTGDMYWIEVLGVQWTTPATNASLRIRFNNETGSVYRAGTGAWTGGGAGGGTDDQITASIVNAPAPSLLFGFMYVFNPRTTTTAKGFVYQNDGTAPRHGLFLTSNAITEVNLFLSNGATFTAGTYKIWEYK
jgi:hypothetical protein